MSRNDLSGHSAFVTGASGDLGRVIAETLASAGADVAVHSRTDAARGEPVAAACRARGRRAVAVTGDISDPAAMAAARDQAAAALGPIDIVVVNAVSAVPRLGVLEQPLEHYLDQFRACVLHAAIAAKTFAPAMRERRWGRIIAINTEATLECVAGNAAYASGKGGMDRLLRCLAKEVGRHGITVNQIAPGWMISARTRGAGGGEHDDGADVPVLTQYLAGVPLGHRGTDSDVAEAVAFLASDAARFITGAFLAVNGGKAMTGI